MPTSSRTRRYSINRKIAVALRTWERSLATDKQVRMPDVSEVLTMDEFEQLSLGQLRAYDKHCDRIWRRLGEKNQDSLGVALDQEKNLSRSARWDSGKQMSAKERKAIEAAQKSSDAPYMITPF